MRIQKGAIAAAVIILSAAAASAQESYTVPVNAARQAQVTVSVEKNNRLDVCKRLGQANTCTQAQACVAASAAGGASCTAAQARQSNARIYPQTQAGREEWFAVEFVSKGLPDLAQHADAAVKALYADWLASQNQATRDAECTKAGAPAGCQ